MEQVYRHVGLPEGQGQVEWRGTVAVGQIDGAAVVDKAFGALHVAVRCGDVQSTFSSLSQDTKIIWKIN